MPMTISRMLVGSVALAMLTASGRPTSPLDVPATKARIDKLLDATYPHLDSLYKNIHQHPELSFQEVHTAATLAKEMRALGFEVTEHVGKTGLVAIYHNGPGPTVMVRTELDALPMEEKTGLPYASHAKQVWNGAETFVDHSCGHDIHMASWVGTATALLSMKTQWSGTLMFIAQPSEEAVSGAKAMLSDGLFTRFPKPDMGFALHDHPEVYGQVGYRAGVFSSNSDQLDVTFLGRGGHGARPHQTIDPVLIASRFVVDVQSVVSREKDPQQFGIVTIGAIHGGTAGNIIPDSVSLVGTIRSYDPGVRQKMIDGINRVARAEAEMAGAPPPVVKVTEGAKAVVNDSALTARTGAVFKLAFGKMAVQLPEPNSASEDYSEFILAGVPSVYFTIGVYSPERVAAAESGGPPLPVNHSPLFAPVPEPTIRSGVEAMTLAVMNVMAK
jgi:amidohydrolase